MKESEDKKISQSNSIIQSKQDLTKVQKNIFYKITEKVRSESAQMTLFGNMVVIFNNKDFEEIDINHKEYIKDALRDLRRRAFEIEDINGNWLNVGIINYSKYLADRKVFEVEVSKEVIPYLVGLTKNFTTYSIIVAMGFKSKYTQRFYEFGCQYKNKVPSQFYIDIEDLRNKFKLGKGYKLKSSINERIINPAIKELKESFDKKTCDLWLEFWEDPKLNRGDNTRYWFKIHTTQEAENPKRKNLDEALNGIDIINRSIFKNDKSFCKRIYQYLKNNPEIIYPVYDKVVTFIEKSSKKNKLDPALWRYILKEDFHIV